MKPVVAIIGRPNVGKSTLFNRMVGRRQALVNDMPGVTRDRQYGQAEWCGHNFIVIDTGGLVSNSETSIETCIKKQTMAAVSEADVIICVFDGREGANHTDRHIVELLRKSGKPVFYAVNKAESLKKSEEDSASFYEMGLSHQPFLISAEHGRGIDDLLDTIVSSVPGFTPVPSEVEGFHVSIPIEPSDHPTIARIALIGRPNVGKSTLINRLAGIERVIAHELPGTTRDAIDIDIKIDDRCYTFVDTAGLKKKGKTIEAVDKFSAIMSLRAIGRADIVLVLIDANEGITHQDSYLIDYAYSEGKGLIVLVNKWDVVKPGVQDREYREFFTNKILKLRKLPILYISAKTGGGLEGLFAEIDRLSAALKKKFPTAELNRLLEDIKESHHIPVWRGHHVKLYYATQGRLAPPEFIIFSNYPETIPDSYKRYVTNRLQEVVGYGVPIRLRFRKKS